MDQSTNNWIESVLANPGGARFHKCALQVNPFDYLGRHDHPTPNASETEYNAALVEALLEADVAAIAITDHFRIESANTLSEAATKAGIVVFPGFEANTKDGVHFLCIFDPATPFATVQARIHECRLNDLSAGSPRCEADCDELLSWQRPWGMLSVAAHVTNDRGLLVAIANGERRADVWKNPELCAAAIPGTPDTVPPQYRAIIANTDPKYARSYPLAILNAHDIKDPSDVAKPGAITEIKMSEITLEGLRQAFIDPETRIRRTDQLREKPHTEILAIRWESGGFLGSSQLGLNSNLNVLIGGRGTGKSTVIESIRYAVDLKPLTDEALLAHQGIVRRVLGEATRISLLVRVHSPTAREYLIERIVPNPAEVKTLDGEITSLNPHDVLPGIEIYGQHEIAELCRDRGKLTGLLRRFAPDEAPLRNTKRDLTLRLDRSRSRILQVEKEVAQLRDRLSTLPGLEEALKRYAQSGLEERLRDQAKLIAEERLIRTATERLDPIEEVIDALDEVTEIDLAFVSEKVLEGLGTTTDFSVLREALKKLSVTLSRAVTHLRKATSETRVQIESVDKQWKADKAGRQAAYEKILRELQKTAPGIDAAEFGKLHKRIAELQPLRERAKKLETELAALAKEREKLVSEWESAKAEHFRLLERAAAKLSRASEWRVRVSVQPGGSKTPLRELCSEMVEGATKPICDRIASMPDFSIPKFVRASRSGAAALREEFGLTLAQAERLAKTGNEFFLRLEELDFPPETMLELNLAEAGQAPDWRELEQLSKGQKATAVLLLLLLESEAPLIVDQPEDDLDNRFVMDGVVPKIRTEKQRRQFLFATHNANIPVLGDAELIAVLEARGEPGSDGESKAGFVEDTVGSIDNDKVRAALGEILEGGKTAFETRRVKYGY